MTDDEKNRYWETYFSTRDTLRFAIVDLDVAASSAKFSSDAATILAEKLRLESELAKLLNESTAVAAGEVAITPPSEGEIDKIKRLADAVDRLTVTANTYSKAVNLAGQALDAYAKIRSA
ncbi:MAG TPA: hypothetical protein VFE97_27555 [Methylomirabilota bacterium]|nr:hypothetical protein [Methylomirabilota bacterium]